MMGGMVNSSGPNVQTQALRPESCKGFIETSRDVTECSGTAWQGESAGECSRNERNVRVIHKSSKNKV